jgi:pimeloyl-ACP methyl ester carboxylesterase
VSGLKVIRFFGDIILAVVLCMLLVALVLLGYGRAMAGPWQITPASSELAPGQWVWVGDRPLHVRTWGPDDGQPVVLVHGLDIGGAAVWAPVTAPLGRAGYRVITVDLPLLGYSSRDTAQDVSLRGQADALATVLNQLGAQNAVVVTQGWGGAVALQVALEQPQFVQSLVLIGPQLELGIDRYERQIAGLPLAQESVTWLMRGGGPVWRVLLRRQVSTNSAPFKTYAQAAREASQLEGTVEALTAFYALDEATNQPAAIRSLRMPCQIVRGEHDRLVTAEQAADLAFELGAETLTVAGAGHLVALDQPDALRRLLLEALQP